jgi:hypothetical protein
VEIKLKCYGSSHHIDENAIVTNQFFTLTTDNAMQIHDS